MTPELCHVTPADSLAQGAFAGDPFLHCCTEAQLPFVLDRHFAGRRGLVVLRFDPAALTSGRIEWAQSEPGMDPFPHLYGSLPLAIAQVSPAPDPWGLDQP